MAHVALPAFSYTAKQPRVPASARVLARQDVADEHGRLIQYIVQATRKAGYPISSAPKKPGAVWWLSATYPPTDGNPYSSYRASGTMRTTSTQIAENWIDALRSGDVSIAR